ncbi:MAG: hypothetical protein EAZ43_11135 [Betaproteobacteria bacterium]|nr:MAG: hypothetical protein EAZ43_11135 [Betaproteobacteria bacterium]
MAKSLAIPIHCISFTDDEMMSLENIESLKNCYPTERMSSLRLTPGELGVKRVGHFGAFRAQLRDSLWERYVWPTL